MDARISRKKLYTGIACALLSVWICYSYSRKDLQNQQQTGSYPGLFARAARDIKAGQKISDLDLVWESPMVQGSPDPNEPAPEDFTGSIAKHDIRQYKSVDADDVKFAASVKEDLKWQPFWNSLSIQIGRK